MRLDLQERVRVDAVHAVRVRPPLTTDDLERVVPTSVLTAGRALLEYLAELLRELRVQAHDERVWRGPPSAARYDLRQLDRADAADHVAEGENGLPSTSSPWFARRTRLA